LEYTLGAVEGRRERIFHCDLDTTGMLMEKKYRLHFFAAARNLLLAGRSRKPEIGGTHGGERGLMMPGSLILRRQLDMLIPLLE
tara:strand:+ start:1567 stop:1818 length:252 start_codon:yes stop_codon:yes gene_type:complete